MEVWQCRAVDSTRTIRVDLSSAPFKRQDDLESADDPDHIMNGAPSRGIRRIPWTSSADAAFGTLET
jgi:hypothetical protein